MDKPDHNRDEDCTVGEDGRCVGCGVSHTDQCGRCGAHGFHHDGCPVAECSCVWGCAKCSAVPFTAPCDVCEAPSTMYCAPCTVYYCDACNADPDHDEVHHRIGAARCDGCGHIAKVTHVADHAHFPGGANLCPACRS